MIPPETAGRYDTLREVDALSPKGQGAALRARHLLEPLPVVAKPADGRLGDIMQPLGQVAAIIGGDIEGTFPAIVKGFRAARQAFGAESTEAQLLAAVQAAIDDGCLLGDVLPTGKVLEIYNASLPEKSRSSLVELPVY